MKEPYIHKNNIKPWVFFQFCLFHLIILRRNDGKYYLTLRCLLTDEPSFYRENKCTFLIFFFTVFRLKFLYPISYQFVRKKQVKRVSSAIKKTKIIVTHEKTYVIILNEHFPRSVQIQFYTFEGIVVNRNDIEIWYGIYPALAGLRAQR